ncbi:MAG: acetyl-CoA carboxylase biotin carboxyl carrier protein [Candidatus Omnitrophica bacterium]|nr:acetyl-CoA carboxylase biotin carboxyl carrier protein [Candidatus Omnitrophota bacterium]
MHLKELKEMINLMKEHDLVELEIEKEGERIRLKKDTAGYAPKEEISHARFIPAVSAPETGAGALPRQEAGNDRIVFVRSPMVGTFYGAPAPDQDPYVTKGHVVKEGDVLCIIEAMKLMNEIKSEINGKVVDILVTNGQPIEFDQPLFKIEKS